MNSHLIKKERRIIIDPVYSDRLSDILDFFLRKEEVKMQNKNNIKNWKIEITNEGAKLFITEGAVMARDVLNLAREQAIIRYKDIQNFSKMFMVLKLKILKTGWKRNVK